MWKSDALGSEGFSCNLTTVLQSRFLKPEYWFSVAAGIFREAKATRAQLFLYILTKHIRYLSIQVLILRDAW